MSQSSYKPADYPRLVTTLCNYFSLFFRSSIVSPFLHIHPSHTIFHPLRRPCSSVVNHRLLSFIHRQVKYYTTPGEYRKGGSCLLSISLFPFFRQEESKNQQPICRILLLLLLKYSTNFIDHELFEIHYFTYKINPIL